MNQARINHALLALKSAQRVLKLMEGKHVATVIAYVDTATALLKQEGESK